MHQFDQDILFMPDDPASFSGCISGNWSISGVPNGGYLIAVLANAMMQNTEMASNPLIAANF